LTVDALKLVWPVTLGAVQDDEKGTEDPG